MVKILEPTETEGWPFTTAGGEHQIILEYGTVEAKLQIQIPESDPARWIDTNESWTDSGVRAMWLSANATYRLIAAVAGASGWVDPLAYFAERRPGGEVDVAGERCSCGRWHGRRGAGVDVTAFADKPTSGRRCACARAAWGKGPRCRTCVNNEKDSEALTAWGPDEMRKDTLLADRPFLRMEVERLDREQ